MGNTHVSVTCYSGINKHRTLQMKRIGNNIKFNYHLYYARLFAKTWQHKNFKNHYC